MIQSASDRLQQELVSQSCLTLCDPMNYSLPGPSVHGILQARILEGVAIPFFRDLPNPRIEPRSPALQADSLLSEPPGKPQGRDQKSGQLTAGGNSNGNAICSGKAQCDLSAMTATLFQNEIQCHGQRLVFISRCEGWGAGREEGHRALNHAGCY